MSCCFHTQKKVMLQTIKIDGLCCHLRRVVIYLSKQVKMMYQGVYISRKCAYYCVCNVCLMSFLHFYYDNLFCIIKCPLAICFNREVQKKIRLSSIELSEFCQPTKRERERGKLAYKLSLSHCVTHITTDGDIDLYFS